MNTYIQPGSVEFYADKYPDLPAYCHTYMSLCATEGEQAAKDFLISCKRPGIWTNVAQGDDKPDKKVFVNW